MTVVVGYSAGCFVVPVHNSKTAVERYSTYAYAPDAVCINSTFRKSFNARSQEIFDVCLQMFNCLQAKQTIAIRKRKFLNKYSVIV